VGSKDIYFINLPDSRQLWHAYEPGNLTPVVAEETLCSRSFSRRGIFIYETAGKAADTHPTPLCRECLAVLFAREVGWSLSRDGLWRRWCKRRAARRQSRG
jgi:hypothetical protein